MKRSPPCGTKQRLPIAREVVRQLSAAQLNAVIGGAKVVEHDTLAVIEHDTLR
jgi:hypothetical protein